MSQAVHHWRYQRLTAVVLIPLSLWFIYTLATMTDMNHGAVSAWIKAPFHGLMLLVFTLALFYHAQLGLQVIIEDYVSAEKLRNFTLLLCRITMYGSGLISILAILRIILGQ